MHLKRTSAAVTWSLFLIAGCGQQTQSDLQDPISSGYFRSEPELISVAEGTVVRARLEQGLSSNGSRPGESFSATIVEDIYVEDEIAVPEGSTIHGVVSEADPAMRGAGRARLALDFTALELPDGHSVGIVASLEETTESAKQRNTAIIGGSAAGGALLGRLLGKDTKGAVVGTIVGGAIGTGVVLSKEGEQVSFPRGSVVILRLDRSVTLQARS